MKTDTAESAHSRTLQLECLELVTRRRSDPDGRRARTGGRRRRALHGGQRRRRPLPPLVIAELSGNPILTLFIRITTAVSARHRSGLGGPKTFAEAEAALVQ